MSDIKVGDLVYVAYAKPCGCDDDLGYYFRVVEIKPAIPLKCFVCGSSLYTAARALPSADLWGGHALPRLKKVPPLEEPEALASERPEPALEKGGV